MKNNMEENNVDLKYLHYFSKFELCLWTISIATVIGTYMLENEKNILTLIATLIGATALIFLAKGNVWGQILTVVFSVLYGIVSYGFRYYGEMITYLCMTGPIALISTVTWLKNPSKTGKYEVEIAPLSRAKMVSISMLTAIVSAACGKILVTLETPNIIFSILSIATSFAAASLTVVRSSYYALAYAANDVILIVLWSMAAFQNIEYLPMVLCFLIFLVNDLYGFYNWNRLHKRQSL